VFGVVYATEPQASLIDVAREFSPRVAVTTGGGREVVLDVSGLARLFDGPDAIAMELERAAAERGLRVRIAIAATQTAARLLARHGTGTIVVAPGGEARALAPLPVGVLATENENDPNDPNDFTVSLLRWGIRTLGALAVLPTDGLVARLGPQAMRWQRMARGEDPGPLVPTVPDERFEQALDLEWPIDGLEPLSFVLGRLFEPLAAHLERRGRGAAVLRVRLQLVTREVHERALDLPVPIRDARTLRTLLLLDLESHPPPAAIDRVEVSVEPTPARIVQCSLLTRPQPAPEQISTLMARLQALMGESRCGAPCVVDSWQPGAFAMRPFAPPDAAAGIRPGHSGGDEVVHSMTVGGMDRQGRAAALALRRFRIPVAARVRLDAGTPVSVVTDRAGLAGGRVTACAGPWRTSGAWWLDPRDGGPATCMRSVSIADAPRQAWDRDEWDVTFADGAVCRIFRDRATDRWFLEGMLD
jgi:protein ImuB